MDSTSDTVDGAMDAARRDEMKALFVQAVALPPEQRLAFLEAACRDDAAGRVELASLLGAYDEAPDYFERLAREALPSSLAEEPRARSRSDPYGLIGQHVDQYQVLSVLGGGGMGVVYQARHQTLGRLAALKFLSPHLGTDADAKARLLHEARTASALDHPNICTIYDVSETETGQLFIAMAYYEGETLKARLKQGPLPVDEVLTYALQVAEGLVSAHARDVIHRDVKPANVLITPEGVAKILDFGLAKVANVHLTRKGSTMGTVAYMSPEQAKSRHIDHRTDLWSLGVVLYEMLAGQRPFQGANEQATIYALLNTDPPPLTRWIRDLPRALGSVVDRCLQKQAHRRFQNAGELLAALCRIQDQRSLDSSSRSGSMAARPAASSDRARLFISYKRSATPDDRVAKALCAALGTQHDVFLDKMMSVGARWIEQIEAQLAKADFLIILLSKASVYSEMVAGEIALAHRLANEQGGRPAMLPVRLAYREPLTYPLNTYLDGLNWAFWKNDSDTPHLVAALEQAIVQGRLAPPAFSLARVLREQDGRAIPEPPAAAQPAFLEMPEGTMDPHSAFYVERPEDAVALRAVARSGVTITLKGPRQMGKSSLLMRMMAQAAADKEIVFLDFQLFDQAALHEADTFFRQFCAWITDELDLEERVDDYWRRPLGQSQRCTRYMDRYVLKTLGQPLLLAMDEVERVFDTPFRSDFFSMLRSWHNDRAIKPRWRQLDLALVTSTEPYQLIENLNQSPFNVGEVISLTDFTPEQVADLNQRHGAPLSEQQVGQLMALLGGHPYLVRKALYLIAGARLSADDLWATASDERGPFGDHLRYHLFRLHEQEDLLHGLRQVLREHRCDDEALFWRLRGAGLVRRAGRDILPRSALYADFFREHLDG